MLPSKHGMNFLEKFFHFVKLSKTKIWIHNIQSKFMNGTIPLNLLATIYSKKKKVLCVDYVDATKQKPIYDQIDPYVNIPFQPDDCLDNGIFLVTEKLDNKTTVIPSTEVEEGRKYFFQSTSYSQ